MAASHTPVPGIIGVANVPSQILRCLLPGSRISDTHFPPLRSLTPRMAPRAKVSDAKRAREDASPSAPAPDGDPESKPSGSVLAQLEELEDAAKHVISLVDHDRGSFAELKRSLSDRVDCLDCQGDLMLR
ncbi:uncharacterized protein A4U43_C04F6210 [Asparagus officinalis]|uniref:Uncharacterized protein n=1 Tax=Asparagus officinalis TaxID=4686 RepID=A0A5P1F354_ASPOF|nr:uncharacterized protein A4U43_C04F6210 [Asparagus officinalis]